MGWTCCHILYWWIGNDTCIANIFSIWHDASYIIIIIIIRVIKALGTTSMGFQILIIANNLFEKILLHGSSGYEIVLGFRIFVLILQEGNYYPTLWNKLYFIGFTCCSLFMSLLCFNLVIQQNMWKNILKELSHYFLLGSTGILATIMVMAWTTTKV